jgi:hypothetical protein
VVRTINQYLSLDVYGCCVKDRYVSCSDSIDIESLQNRLLKVCYVPATSAGIQTVSSLFSLFVAAAINITNEANKAGSMCH